MSDNEMIKLFFAYATCNDELLEAKKEIARLEEELNELNKSIKVHKEFTFYMLGFRLSFKVYHKQENDNKIEERYERTI